MRILWMSNYTSQSGYSHQARLFVPRIAASGHHVNVLNISGGSNMAQQVGNIQLLPSFNDSLGRDAAPYHYNQMRAHILFSLIDTWAYKDGGMDQMYWYPWTPVDLMPLMPDVGHALKDCKTPIAMSRWGEQVLRQAGFDPLYVPLAIDASWQPGDKRVSRAKLGWPDDKFIAAFVGVNDSVPSRKGIFEVLGAWQMFTRDRPDSLLYLHTSHKGNLSSSNRYGGIDIPQTIEILGINPETLIWVDQGQYKSGIPTSHLVEVARAADVLVAPSRGEGFGLVPVEFQACGCPVISTDFSAQSELNFGGWLIEYEPDMSWQGSVWAKPSMQGIVDSLEATRDERNDPRRKQAVIDGARVYTVDRVVQQYMLPVLNQIGERILEAV